MNKRCTNSYCRKTFSTLNFDGHCPWCGKAYPQLAPAVNGTCRGAFIKLQATNGKRPMPLWIDLTEVLDHIRADRRLYAAKALHTQFQVRGYRADLRSVLNFCRALQDGKQPCTVWHKTGEIRDNLPVVKARDGG
ncbi:MAG: hypothetical protein IKQ92_02925 [Clostridia bacterium]|nr:hypothetical protein [Clostridia bacterium]